MDSRRATENRCRAIQSIFASKRDNQDPALVRQFAEAYLAIPREDPKQTWNGGLPLLNRLLWCNLEALPKSLFSKIVARLTSDEYLLRADAKKLTRVHELNGKRLRPLDLLARLRGGAGLSVHNSFHYEVLALAKSIKDRDLTAFCDARLSELVKLMNST